MYSTFQAYKTDPLNTLISPQVPAEKQDFFPLSK